MFASALAGRSSRVSRRREHDAPGVAYQGFLRAAQPGTLFLDEVGELPVQLQPKLLRVLEERVVWPLGAGSPVPLDVRIISATDVDLRSAQLKGAFRSDLYAPRQTPRHRARSPLGGPR